MNFSEPHPLDFDWRFTETTVRQLSDLCSGSSRVLALGTPTVACHFGKIGKNFTLIDRQRFPHIKYSVQSPIEDAPPLNDEFDCSIADPPWYPEFITNWANYAGRAVRLGKPIYISIWPNNARPKSEVELATVINVLSQWADVSLESLTPRYSIPIFEESSARCSDNAHQSLSPKQGRLMRLTYRNLPPPTPNESPRDTWTRFVLNDYQLAVKLPKSPVLSTPPHTTIVQMPDAIGWIWPFVSRRAVGREKINVWSSHNEVAMASDTEELLLAIRAAVGSSDSDQFERRLSKYKELLSWDIPRPPYWRLEEWKHLQ